MSRRILLELQLEFSIYTPAHADAALYKHNPNTKFENPQFNPMLMVEI